MQKLTSELSLLVSELRVRSFAARYELEQVASALARNVECGFWAQARRAALDLSGVLALAGRRRQANEVDPVFWTRGLGGIPGLLFIEGSRNHGEADATES